MILNVWILLVLVALGTLALSLFASNDEIALLTSAIASVLWLVVSYGALNIETFSRQQDQYIIQSEPALAVLALIGVLLALLNACVIVFDWFAESTDDVGGY